MKLRKGFSLLFLCLLLASCRSQSQQETQLPTPNIKITSAPAADAVVEKFLDSWESGDTSAMYQMLSTSSRQSFTEEAFTGIYEETALNATLQSLTVDLLSVTTNPNSASATYLAIYETAVFGTFERDIEMTLSLEQGGWKINWHEGLILPELAGGNRLRLDAVPQQRGNIYDRDGNPIVEETTAYALAIIPNQIEDGGEGILLNTLSRLTGRTTQSIQESYDDIRQTNWYVPVGEASEAEINEIGDFVYTLGGLQLSKFTSRYTYNGGIAPQAIGYVQPIPAEEVDDYRLKGYLGDEKVGQAGLERYADDILAGKPSASLYVVDSDGQILSRINQTDAVPSQNITTTLDRTLQIEAQKALQGFRGAIVVLEAETGRVLAMASSPSLDPNLFAPENRNSAELLADQLNDGQQRLLNRATQGTYPPGSVFKIIGMAAALESDLYTPDTVYYCGSYFEELPGERFEDWTVAKELPPSGNLTLTLGLTRSCNPWFYHIGLDLFRQKGATYLADVARGFGLGRSTGIEQVAEATGQIIDPKSDGDAVQQGIGQGDMLVTPLQIANFTAAIANYGTLHRPQLIERITSSNGVDVFTFSPEVSGTLPVSEETIDAIREGMRGVIRSKVGTANRELGDMGITLFGKTGTASNSTGESHAWFTGFSSTLREDKPDIVVTVLLENAGEGSERAAPVFRRVMETYYFGEPQKLYPWESGFNVTRTPTLEFTPTPERPSSSNSVPEQQVTTPTPAG
jgi:penicillin-binding protein 2